MPTNRSTAYRDATAAARTTFVGNAAKLSIETAAGAVLAVFTCGSPFSPAPSSGVRSITLPAATTWGASGTVGRARLFAADGTTLIEQYTVGTSGAEVNLSSLTAVSGGAVSVTSWTSTEPT